jgi:hypothetical protein
LVCGHIFDSELKVHNWRPLIAAGELIEPLISSEAEMSPSHFNILEEEKET